VHRRTCNTSVIAISAVGGRTADVSTLYGDCKCPVLLIRGQGESYILASGDETEADSQHRLYQSRPTGMPQPASCCCWWWCYLCCSPGLVWTGFVGKGSDYLQLIKFWPSCAPGKGVCSGTKIFGSALIQPARSVCDSLSAFFH